MTGQHICRVSEQCVVVAVLNNDSVEFTEEYCPSDVMQALQQRGWVISADEQVVGYLVRIITLLLHT